MDGKGVERDHDGNGRKWTVECVRGWKVVEWCGFEQLVELQSGFVAFSTSCHVHLTLLNEG